MSASERAQALHYRQQVEALFDDYAPDFEAFHHVGQGLSGQRSQQADRPTLTEVRGDPGLLSALPQPGGGRLGRHWQ